MVLSPSNGVLFYTLVKPLSRNVHSFAVFTHKRRNADQFTLQCLHSIFSMEVESVYTENITLGVT